MPDIEPVSLGRQEAVAERPFTALDHIDADIELLHGMLDDVSRVLTEADTGARVIKNNEKLSWFEDGLIRRLMVCDEKRLRAHGDLCVVGFFGERRVEIPNEPLEEANTEVVAQFKDYPGILSYSSVELPNGYWANMVLHDDPVDREYWRRSALHAEAAKRLSPLHYRNVRIHNMRLTDRVLSDPQFTVTRTKYWDYSETPEWTAIREMGEPAGDTVAVH